MPPERSKPRHIDGVRRPAPARPRQDLRPEHDLPAPPRQKLIREHEPEALQPVTPVPVSQESAEPAVEQPGTEPRLDDIVDEEPIPRTRKKLWVVTVVVTLVVALIVAATAYGWYQSELQPVSTDTTKHIRVTIAPGSTPSQIADELEKDGVIRSKTAFAIYTKLTGTENKLKAGAYSLQPSLSTTAIVDHLVSGKQDTFDITFLPGDTLTNNRDKLIKAGFSADDVDAALKKAYDSPLFATKPTNADLEGYFYGETNEFDTAATVPSILERYFDQYNDFIVKNNIVAGFQKQGLTLYQGITLASIVQREMSSNSKDMSGVARVFLNRLKAGMTLGSDVTYQYAAKKLGVAPDPSLDSPYNTRKYPGLPPGPIATPGNTALLAVANPADNNYLFFLSGDDDVTYYAMTDAQHQQNIQQHCQKKCSVN